MTKWVYSFGDGKAEGGTEMRNLLGGKGANLAEMSALGIPVPPGFTIPTDVCVFYYDNQNTYPDELKAQVETAMVDMESALGNGFGSVENPLLVSVRSGARASMPGMMDTVLNLGLNDKTVEGLATRSATHGLPMTVTGVSSRCTAMWFWVSITIILKTLWKTTKTTRDIPWTLI